MKKHMIWILPFLFVTLVGAGYIVDNIYMLGNVIGTTDTDGALDLQPNGTGWTRVDSPLKVNGSSDGDSATELDVTGDGIFSGTLVVSDTDAPAAGIEFEVTGDGVISTSLAVGSGSQATAGVELDVTGESEFSSTVTFDIEQILTHITTPSNPASGFVKIYAKSDDSLYILNSAGSETALGSAAVNLTHIDAGTDYLVTSAKLECDGSSQILQEDGAWLDSIGNIASGACAITMTSGVFSNTPVCTISARGGNRVTLISPTSSTAATADCFFTDDTDCTSWTGFVICVGQD